MKKNKFMKLSSEEILAFKMALLNILSITEIEKKDIFQEIIKFVNFYQEKLRKNNDKNL